MVTEVITINLQTAIISDCTGITILTGEIQGLLLGDSGYPCRRYLLTPYQTPQTPVQVKYTSKIV
jgi:hypothetical protein